MHMCKNYPEIMTLLLFRYLPEVTGRKLSFTRSNRHDEPREPMKSTQTLEIVLQTRPSALGMSDPGVDPLEILEVPEFISFLKFLEGD